MVSPLSALNLHAQPDQALNSLLAGRESYERSQLNKQALQRGQQEISQFERDKAIQKISVINKLTTKARSLPTIEERRRFVQSLNHDMLRSVGIDPADLSNQGLDDASLDDTIAQSGAALPTVKSTGEAASFNEMTTGLSQADKEKARRIELGLDPRAVGSASQTIAENGTASKVGASEAEIVKQKEMAAALVRLGIDPERARRIAEEEASVKLNTQPGIEAATTAARETASNAVAKDNEQKGNASRLPEFDAAYENLVNSDLDKIYGRGESLYPDFARSQKGVDLKASRDQLVSMLKLGARGQLKGQGSITDSEQKTLSESVSVLANPDISPSLAKGALKRARDAIYASSGRIQGGSGKGGATPGINSNVGRFKIEVQD